MEYNKVVSNSSPWGEKPSLKSFLDDIEEIPKDDGDHPLLADESPGYAASVIQRSLVTWMHLGKKEGFAKICKYYHYLEKEETSFTPLQKAQSRKLEMEHINQAPASSDYFLQHWGHIYGFNNKADPLASAESKLDKIWETDHVSQTTKIQLQENMAPNLSVYWR